jgi:hypothetical protein
MAVQKYGTSESKFATEKEEKKKSHKYCNNHDVSIEWEPTLDGYGPGR